MNKLILLVLGFLAFLPITAPCETRGEIRTEVRQRLRDTDTTNPRWSTAILDARIDIAELEFTKLARQPIQTSYITTFATTSFSVSTYSLPTDCLVPIRVAYAIKPLTSATTNYKRMDYMTVDGMDNANKGNAYWEDASADYPSKYMYPETGIIRIYPPPSTTYAGTNFLKITYAVRVSTMSSDSAVPFNGNTFMYAYHDSLSWYVCFLCAVDTGLMDMAKFYYDKFMADVNIALGQFNDKPDKQGGFAPK